MNRRDFLKLSSASLLALNLTGCVTAAMYHDRYSTERLSSVLISQDGKHLVAMTDEHDYIFDNTPRLSAIIQGKLHPYASARFGGFHTTSGGATSGTVTVSLAGLPDSLKPQARKLGFTMDGQNKLALDIALQGTRYKRRGGAVAPGYRLNETYFVRIRQDPSALTTAGRILATPITVAIDGALLLSGVALILVFQPTD